MAAFDLAGALRRIRRRADMSQRELAEACGCSQSVIARAELGQHDLPAGLLARAAELAGWRVTLVDDAGAEVPPMSSEAVRDQAGRRFPAHLDTRYGDEDWWHGDERYARPQPHYTFDRLRYTRDHWRGRTGIPDDHLVPRPGDSPEERRAARKRAARRRREEDYRRRLTAGLVVPTPEFECACPDECDELDDRSGRPVHAEGCPCLCDVA